MVRVEIITIGDELLIGQVIDTNSAWIASHLNPIGLDVEYITTVGDDEADILDAFGRALSRASVVLVTGGIGPTKDDITRKSLCRFFDTPLIFNKSVLENIEEILQRMNRPVNKLTRNQAYVPRAATVIRNRMGTAPITWFEHFGKVLVSMPGVPYEMKWVMEEEIIPRLASRFGGTGSILHHSLWVKNYTESQLAMKLADFEGELPSEIKLAYLPASGLIRLRLSGRCSDQEALEREMSSQKEKLLALLDSDILSERDESPEYILDRLLKEKGLTLALAESCTGGKLASLFTAIPGCSSYFRGGAVAYSNDIKSSLLGVSVTDLLRHGAVSYQVVEQMASGVQEAFGADCAIATSGIAGPGGGSEEKPVGSVWISARYGNKSRSKFFHFPGSRENVIQRSCNSGIMLLINLITN